MRRPFISIVVPVYNVEEYITQCLESVLSQNTENVEIILVNDGSTDGSADICRNYSKQYPNVRFISQKNCGLSEARNTGIRNASGEYLLFLDSDDYLDAGCLNKIKNYIVENDGVDIFFGKAKELDIQTQIITDTPYEYPGKNSAKDPAELFWQLEQIPSFWFAAWLAVVRREFIFSNDLFFQKGLLHEDELWIPSIFLKASSAVAMNESFYIYRTGRSSSIIGQRNIKKSFDKLKIADMFNQYDKNSIDSQFKTLILRKRKAALTFGVLLNLSEFVNDLRFDELLTAVSDRVIFLKYGKYRSIYLLTKLFGIKFTAKLLSLIFSR